MSGGCVLVSGATGLVGRRLVPKLVGRFETVRVLSRSARSGAATTPGLESRSWDGIDPGAAAVAGTGAIVHLAGEPIFGGAPTKARLARVRESRVASTRRLVERIAALPEGARPRSFVCASAVGYYGDRGDERLDESSSAGSGVLAEVCRDWEAEASRAEALGVRVVRLRIGVVLAREGGALSLMKVPFSLGVGGRIGSGLQFFPWIHIDDLVGAIVFALEQESLRGAVNAVAPSPVRNLELTQTLGRVLGRPTILPVPGFALRAALGPLADELLGSRCVLPRRLEEAGFAFRHPDLEEALETELDR